MKNLISYTLLDTLANNLNILIFSDNSDSKEVLDNFFKKLNSKIVYMNGHDETLKYSAQNSIDIIFIDLNSTETNPFKLVQEIKYQTPLQYVVGISNKDNKEILYKSIRYDLNDFLLHPFSEIQLKDSTIRCLEKRFYSNKKTEDSENLVKSHKPSEILQSLLEKERFEVDLVGQYKGVPIIKKATLIEVQNENVLIKIDQVHKYILNYSKKIAICSTFLSYDINAYLKNIDEENDIATFENLEFIDSYIHHRQNVRIVPDTTVNILLFVKNIKYNCDLINISEDYALFKMSNIPTELKINSNLKVHISFKIPNTTTNKPYSLETVCTVQNIFKNEGKYEILIHFELENQDKKFLQLYINKRGIALIKEFRKESILKK